MHLVLILLVLVGVAIGLTAYSRPADLPAGEVEQMSTKVEESASARKKEIRRAKILLW